MYQSDCLKSESAQSSQHAKPPEVCSQMISQSSDMTVCGLKKAHTERYVDFLDLNSIVGHPKEYNQYTLMQWKLRSTTSECT